MSNPYLLPVVKTCFVDLVFSNGFKIIIPVPFVENPSPRKTFFIFNLPLPPLLPLRVGHIKRRIRTRVVKWKKKKEVENSKPK
jgi:hypothetical protein